MFRLYSWLLLRNPTYKRFTHVHLFPNMLLYFGDVYSSLTVVQPLGPTRTRYTMFSFAPQAVRWGPPGRLLQALYHACPGAAIQKNSARGHGPLASRPARSREEPTERRFSAAKSASTPSKSM